MFDKTRARITEPLERITALAVTALVFAIIAFIAAVTRAH